MATRLRNYLKRHSITPILTFPGFAPKVLVVPKVGILFQKSRLMEKSLTDEYGIGSHKPSLPPYLDKLAETV